MSETGLTSGDFTQAAEPFLLFKQWLEDASASEPNDPSAVALATVDSDGLPDVRMHDIRRTLGSWMVDTGAPLAVIGKQLGHRDAKSTTIYARLDVEPVRRAVERAERALRKIFPEIRGVSFDYHWHARGAAAADLLPHLYEPQAGLFAALGFAGRGIAMGTALGRALARRVRGEAAESIGFPVTSARLPLGLSSVIR